MDTQAERDIIAKTIPPGSIVAEHTDTSHHYRVNLFPGSPLLDSVTTKTGILNKGYLKDWGIRLAIDYIRDNIDAVINEETREGIFLDAKGQSQGVLEDAGDVGTKVHNVIETYIDLWIERKQPDNILSLIQSIDSTDVRIIAGVKAAGQFFNDHDIFPICSELLVASKKLGTAGTMDFLCYIGKTTVEGNRDCDHEMWQRGSKKTHFGCTKCDRVVDYVLTIVDWKTSNSIAGKTEYALQTAAYKQAVVELTGLKPEQAWIIRLDKKTGKYEKGVVSDLKKAIKAYELVAGLYEYMNDGSDKLPIITKEKNTLII
jgi:hypothetical protein